MQTLEQYVKTNPFSSLTCRIVTDYIRKHPFKVNSKHTTRNITNDDKHNIAIQFISELQQIHPMTNGIAIECLVCILLTFQNEIYKQPIELMCCAEQYFRQTGRPINKINKFIRDCIISTNNGDVKNSENDNANSVSNNESLTNETVNIANNNIENKLENEQSEHTNEQIDLTDKINLPTFDKQTKDLVINMFKSIKIYRDTLSHINQTIHDAYLTRNIPIILLFYIVYYIQEHLDHFLLELDYSIAEKYILKLLTNWDKVILIFDYLNELNSIYHIETLAYNIGCGKLVNKNKLCFKGTIDVLINNKIIIDIKCSKQNTFAYYARQLNMYRSFVEFRNNLNPNKQYKHDEYKMYTVNISQNKIYEFPITDIDINEFID